MADRHDLVIEQGTTWSLEMVWKDSAGDPINMVGYLARMKIAKGYHTPGLVMDLTSGNGGTTIVPLEGKITCEMTDEQTALIPAGKYVYEILLEQTILGTIEKFLYGGVTVVPGVA